MSLVGRSFGRCLCSCLMSGTARVLRAESPLTRGRRSIGSGGESSSMLTSVERNAVQVFSKGNNFLPHCVALCWRFSLDNVHTSDVKFHVLNGWMACWLVWSGMQYRRSQKEIISYLIVLHCVGVLVSIMFTHPMFSFMCWMADSYTFHCYIHEEQTFLTSLYKEECCYDWTWDVYSHWRETND
jgi:hypothetical protein